MREAVEETSPRTRSNMKHPTNTPFPVQYAQLPVYVLAVLLATFIAALHAGILFGLADLLRVLRGWAKAVAADRPADILVVVAAICALFTAHIGETAIGPPFSGSRVSYHRLPTAGILPAPHTQLSGTGIWS